MGIQSGSLSISRYRLIGGRRKFGPERLSTLSSLIEPHKAAPLKLSGVKKEELVGWVRPVGIDGLGSAEDDPLAPWDMSHCQIDDGFLLRLRLERRRVPGTLLQLIYKQKYFEERQASGKPPGPKQRRELKEHLKLDLTGRSLPQIAQVDAFWRERQGELMLFGSGRKLKETFERHFIATFAGPLELTLVRVEAPLLGLTSAEWEDNDLPSLGKLSATTPTTFAEAIYP